MRSREHPAAACRKIRTHYPLIRPARTSVWSPAVPNPSDAGSWPNDFRWWTRPIHLSTCVSCVTREVANHLAKDSAVLHSLLHPNFHGGSSRIRSLLRMARTTRLMDGNCGTIDSKQHGASQHSTCSVYCTVQP